VGGVAAVAAEVVDDDDDGVDEDAACFSVSSDSFMETGDVAGKLWRTKRCN
jgi:hypothetical protein